MADQIPIDIVVPGQSNRYSLWSHIFQGKNTTWTGFNTNLTLGNFFNGLQGLVESGFDTQIPPGATILSATFEATPRITNLSVPFTAEINAPDRGLATQQQDAIQKPFQNWTGWREDLWSNAQVGALSTTFTAVFGTSVTTNASWDLRPSAMAPGATEPMRDMLAQRITTRTGNMEIATLLWDLSRVGVPPGDIRVRIEGVLNDRGVDVPDGIDQGAGPSDGLLASTVPLVQAVQGFSWSGANPVLQPLTDYFIILEVDYPPSSTDFINSWHQNAFLISGGGQLRHYGTGQGFDWANFPGTVDLSLTPGATGHLPQDVTWPIDGVVANVVEVSPDISVLIQAIIDEPNYTIDSGILLNLTRVLPTVQNRRWHPNDAVPHVLRISYLLPVDDEKLADPASRIGRHRIVEPWDPAYYRFKYGRDPVDKVKPDNLDNIERPNVMA